MKTFWLGAAVAIVMVSASHADARPTKQRSITADARIVNVRLVPYTTPTGIKAQMLLVDWKSIGGAPVRLVNASIDPVDKAGNHLGSGAKDYTIYAEYPYRPGIKPGKTYHEPKDEGFVLLPFYGKIDTVNVRITRVDSKSSL